jgi:hypothetical protein
MLTAIYALILIACSSILGLFGFFVGRCGRKLPLIDDHLPWAIHRGQIPHTGISTSADASPARWPQDSLCELLTCNARNYPLRRGPTPVASALGAQIGLI